MTLDKNVFPYYDDYDETKKYLQLMFRPGFAVQARELSQIQSTIQKQIERFGNHVFKEGSMVIPGEAGLDLKLPYIKLENQYASVNIDVANFANKKILGITSGTVATVIEAEATVDLDPNTLYVRIDTGQSTQAFTCSITTGVNTVSSVSIDATDRLTVGALITGTGIPANTYITSITDANTFVMSNQATATNASASLSATTSNAFQDGEDVVTLETVPVFAKITADSNGNTGYGSRAQIKQGVYYANGYFCFVEPQSLLLDKYTNTPSYKIGLRIIENYVTEVTDESLTDPAQGFNNANAPGAHRYQITLTLSKYTLIEEVPDNFIELIRVNNGEIQKLVTRPEYSELEKTLARRTEDESGDYTVRQFPLHVREHLNDGTNFGVYSSSDGGDSTKLVYQMEPGKAYVKGFEIETKSVNLLNVDKARTTSMSNGTIIPFTLGNYVDVDNVNGLFDVTTYDTVTLVNAPKADTNYPGLTLGTAKVRAVEFLSGTPGTATAKYRVWLFDIQMDVDSNGAKYLFSAVKSLYLDATVNADTVLVAAETILYDVNNNAAILKLPETAVETLKDTFDAVDITYTVRRYETGLMSGNSLTLTAGTNEIYSSYSATNYQVAIVSASATALGNLYANGDIIDLSAVGNSVVLSGAPTGKQVIITIPDIADSTIEVITTINKTNVAEKTKTLTQTNETLAHGASIQLGKADIFDIVSIVTDDSNATDITDRYILDNGQRDNFYDRGKLTFKTGYPAPASANVVITYRYFTHGSGDYFSVDSYDGVINYNDIQTHTSPVTGATYDLRNCIDFRPRINDTGTGFSVTSEIVPSGQNFTTDIYYYLSRIDKIFLDSFGNFRLISGVPDKNPLTPNDPSDGMVLYEVKLPAYTFQPSDATIKKIDNRRYTMRDIGRLEKRIENLEYYTSLSLLEKETAELFIDDGTGANRFKNGFLVDNFTSHIVGDTTLGEYACSIDQQNRLLRPPFTSSSVPAVLSTGDSSNYQKTGDLITLPYTTTPLISQPYASNTENVNPYDVFSWVGAMVLTPETDEWYEETQSPDRIIQNDDGLADSLAALNGQVIWDDWQTNWIGSPISVVEAGRTKIGVQRAGRGWPIRDVFRVTQLVTSQQGQTRSGIQLNVLETTNTQNLGDRVVSTDTIPWIREKTISFSCKTLKPNTRVYPYFDNVNVSAYCTPTGGTLGDPIITNVNGEASGTFAIPNNNTIKFRTGERIFKLTDDINNDVNFTTTSASAPYIAKGILQTKQNTILSTRTAQVVTTNVEDTRTILGQSLRDSARAFGNWYDPLAQTFLIDKEGGVFLSKIDLYFATADTKGIPVTVQIRNVVNGYPGPNIVPFSTVTLNPTSVNTSTDGQTATTFTFDSPVYLEHNTEYCFVIMSNSNEYTVWTSKIGEFDVFTGERISEQPYAGVMFKSQNASTWTPDQEQDIKFNIHRCVFNTALTGTLVFKNGAVSNIGLANDPFYTTADSSGDIVLVEHKNHSLRNGDIVTISGVSGTQNGIPDTELNASHTITLVDTDHYYITVTTMATATGLCGGANVITSRNLLANVVNTYFETLDFPETNMSWGIKLADASEVLHTNYNSIVTKSNVELSDERYIYSTDNEPATKSAVARSIITSTNDALSPVIDTQRASLITVTNRINNLITNELTAISGDALARYITKKITLSSPASAVRVYFSAWRPPSASINVYVKYQVDSDKVDAFDDLGYTELTQIEYPSASETEFKDYVFELGNLSPFSVFAIKIVMTSTETSDPVLIRDFRTIALGT